MNLFEIRKEIEQVILNSPVDEETGEILIDEQALSKLEMAKVDKIEACCCVYLNLEAEENALDFEIKKLTQRKKNKSKEKERVKNWVEFNLEGENFETPKCKIVHRKSKACEVADGFVRWALEHDRDDLLSYKDPEPNKKEITNLLKAGESVPFCEYVEHCNMSIK